MNVVCDKHVSEEKEMIEWIVSLTSASQRSTTIISIEYQSIDIACSNITDLFDSTELSIGHNVKWSSSIVLFACSISWG